MSKRNWNFNENMYSIGKKYFNNEETKTARGKAIYVPKQ